MQETSKPNKYQFPPLRNRLVEVWHTVGSNYNMLLFFAINPVYLHSTRKEIGRLWNTMDNGCPKDGWLETTGEDRLRALSRWKTALTTTTISYPHIQAAQSHRNQTPSLLWCKTFAY